MAQLNDLVVTGKSRFLNEIQGNVSGTASNVTGTVAIAHGGTGATTRLGAAKALTDEPVTTPGFVVGLTDNWGKFGYTSIPNLKTTIGSASAASGGTAITMCTTGEKYTWNNKLDKSGGTMTGNITYNLHEEISGGTLICDRTTKVNERGLQYTSTQNSSINPTSNVYIGSRANDLDGMSSIVVCTGTDSTWQSGSEYRTHITPSSIQVSYGNKTQSSSVTVQSGDIMNNSKWDGTNTSLVTALANKMTNQVQSAQVGISCLKSNMMMYKCGRIVYFSIIADFNSTGLPSKVTTNVGSITATDWQPISTCDSGLKGHNNQTSMSINSNGTITMYNYTNAALTAGWFRWSCSYITKQ